MEQSLKRVKGLQIEINRSVPRKKIFLLYFLIVSLPFFSFPPFTVTIGDTTIFRLDWAIAGLLIIVFLLDLCLGRQKIKKNGIGNAVLVLNAVAILTLSNLFNSDSSHLYDFLTLGFLLVFMTLLFFTISSLEITKSQVRNVLKFWIITAFFISWYGIYQMFARNFGLPGGYIGGLTHGYGPSGFAGYIRPSSFFGEASWLGNYLIVPILLVGAALPHRKRESFLFRSNLFNLVIFFTIIVAIFLSFSLAAYSIIGGVLLISLLNKHYRWRIIKITLISLVIIISASFLLQYLGINYGNIVITRVKAFSFDIFQLNIRLSSTAARTSFKGRAADIIVGLKIWLNHPIIGVGLNNYRFYSPQYGGAQFSTVSSFWVQSLVEGGILLFGAFVSLYGVTLVYLKRSIRIARNSDQFSYIALTAFYYIIWAQVLSGFVTHSWIHSSGWISLSLACLLTSFARETVSISKKQDENTPNIS